MPNANGKPLILIVDDTPTNVQVLAETLRGVQSKVMDS